MGRSLIALIAVAGMLNHAAFAADLTATRTPPNSSQEIGDLGTVDEYVRGSPDSASGASEVTALGISVMNGTTQLEGKRPIKGVRIRSVLPRTAAAIAGLRGEQAAVSAFLTAGFVVAGMFFPPAALGAIVVQNASIGESYDVIIAIDGQRTRNVHELRQALAGATSGELVYLVLVRDGRRHNAVVALQ
ncbi:MAG: PDZ domain-containing protein [Deltaproteobacteria bacterium]|nr:PDZ domain-containing protein [Deltaproteobacteria bacterium]